MALATWQSMPQSCPDDAHLLQACREAGLAAEPHPWDDPGVAWGGFDAVVIRATWDYYVKHEAFLRWLDRLEGLGVPVFNPPPVLRWNSDKGYLPELAAKGVAVVPTRLIERGQSVKLARVLDEEGWDAAVVKPAVSAGAYCTFRTSRREAPEQQRGFEELLARDGVLVQPFVPEVAQGEWSLVFLDGAFSHAVVKKPGKGDFRVQEKHGGTVAAAQAKPEHVRQAAAVLAHAPGPLLYARVDAVVRGGALLLMELEVLEPELFWRAAHGSAARFVRVLRAKVGRS